MRLTPARLAAISAVCFLLFAAGSTVKGQDAQNAEIRKAVDQFCAWDFDGARLTSRNPHFKAAVGMLNGSGDWPEEPISIVSSYRVAEVHARGGHGKVAVQYRMLAEIRGGLERDDLLVLRRRNTIWLPITRIDANWKMDVAELPPHVSIDAMRSHIMLIRKDDEEAGDLHRQELLGTLISELGKLGTQPGASRDRNPTPNQK